MWKGNVSSPSCKTTIISSLTSPTQERELRSLRLVRFAEKYKDSHRLEIQSCSKVSATFLNCSERNGHGGLCVCLGDGQTEAE